MSATMCASSSFTRTCRKDSSISQEYRKKYDVVQERTMTKDNRAQRASPAYRLPALDPDFLLSDSMRGVRLHLEYQKAEEILRAWTVRSTIVVFGSARVLPHGASHEGASTAPLPPRAEPRPGGRSEFWYEEARRFGRI